MVRQVTLHQGLPNPEKKCSDIGRPCTASGLILTLKVTIYESILRLYRLFTFVSLEIAFVSTLNFVRTKIFNQNQMIKF